MDKTKTKRTLMAWALGLGLSVLLPTSGGAQRTLTLDSCRAMALRNNKQMGVARVKQEVNANLRKSARTQYLPKVNALGGYLWMNKEVSILNDDQKATLNNMGTNLSTNLQNALSPLTSALPTTAQDKMVQDMAQLAGALNQTGAGIVDAFRTHLYRSCRHRWRLWLQLGARQEMAAPLLHAPHLRSLQPQQPHSER